MSDELSIQRLRSLMDTGAATRRTSDASSLAPSATSGTTDSTTTTSFADTLKESLAEVNDLKVKADQAVADMASGQTSDVQGTIQALEKADVSFKMMMEVRNKLVSAYKEIMQTTV
jgi:flagellar hook-basal body complex protein FliE